MDVGDLALAASRVVKRWWESDQPFTDLATVLAARGPYYRYANSIAALWRDLLTPLSEGMSALVIGHSGELEACLPMRTMESGVDNSIRAKVPVSGMTDLPGIFRDVELLRLP